MTSPFDRVPATKTATAMPKVAPQAAANVPVPVRAASPLASVKATAVAAPKMLYTVDDIDNVGKDADAKLSQLSSRVTKKMTLNRMGDIGDMLMAVQREVNNLDPTSLVKTDGLFGKIRQRFIDIKVELTKRFQTADGAFTALKEGMTKHIVQLTEWEKDDEALYVQNFERFKEILESISQIDLMIAQMKAQYEAWPVRDPSDPEAMMKAQDRLKLADLIDRASVRREALLRSKLKCELNAPEILAMKSASGKLVSKLKSNANDVLPEMLRECAKQIQRIQIMEAVKGVKAFQEFANAALVSGAQATKDTVLQANQAFSDATITVNTITVLQQSVKDMVVGVQSISVEAEKRRIAEEAQINANQANLLKELQKVPDSI